MFWWPSTALFLSRTDDLLGSESLPYHKKILTTWLYSWQTCSIRLALQWPGKSLPYSQRPSRLSKFLGLVPFVAWGILRNSSVQKHLHSFHELSFCRVIVLVVRIKTNGRRPTNIRPPLLSEQLSNCTGVSSLTVSRNSSLYWKQSAPLLFVRCCLTYPETSIQRAENVPRGSWRQQVKSTVSCDYCYSYTVP